MQETMQEYAGRHITHNACSYRFSIYFALGQTSIFPKAGTNFVANKKKLGHSKNSFCSGSFLPGVTPYVT